MRSFYLPYRLIGWCAKHGWHASNVRCAACSQDTKGGDDG